MSICKVCEKEFSPNKSWQKWCSKICKKVSTRKYLYEYYRKNNKAEKRGRNTGRMKDKEHISKMNSKFKKRCPEKLLLSYAKSRAKKSGIDFNIEESDIIINEYCPVLGIKMVIGEEGGRSCSPSLDRVDNSKGYVKGNVQVISLKANTIKNSASIEDIKAVLRYMEKYS